MNRYYVHNQSKIHITLTVLLFIEGPVIKTKAYVDDIYDWGQRYRRDYSQPRRDQRGHSAPREIYRETFYLGRYPNNSNERCNPQNTDNHKKRI